jgi:hypothetical protein
MLLGGVAPMEILYTYTYLFVVAALVCTWGLLLSSLLRRSIGAISATYAILLALAMGSWIVPWVVFTIPFMTHGGGSSFYQFGDGGATAVVLIYGLVVGWLLFRALRWIWRRSPRKVKGRLMTMPAVVGKVVQSLVSLVMLVIFAQAAYLIYFKVQTAFIGWLIMLNPYAGLSGILGGSFARMLTTGLSGITGSSVPSVSLYPSRVWAIGGGIFLTLALTLWMLSIRAFRKRACSF